MSIEVLIWLIILVILDLLAYSKYYKAPTNMFEVISFALVVPLLAMVNIATMVTILMKGI